MEGSASEESPANFASPGGNPPQQPAHREQEPQNTPLEGEYPKSLQDFTPGF
jgi:hypothetical protein